MQELCKSLELLGGFVCEFEELDSPIRKLRDAVRCNIYFIMKGLLFTYSVMFRVVAYMGMLFYQNMILISEYSSIEKMHIIGK
jgi:hypothetical protein